MGLAQALLNNPEVLILDEPTAGLDPKQIIETRELIKDLAGDHTVVLSTHILPEVSQTCQRVVIINRGKVVAVDTPDNLTSRLRGSESQFLQVDARGADAAAEIGALDGVTGVTVTEQRERVDRARSGQPDRPGHPAGAGRRRGEPRMGPAGASADAHEPGGRLPDPDDDRSRRARAAAGDAAAPTTEAA